MLPRQASLQGSEAHKAGFDDTEQTSIQLRQVKSFRIAGPRLLQGGNKGPEALGGVVHEQQAGQRAVERGPVLPIGWPVQEVKVLLHEQEHFEPFRILSLDETRRCALA